MCAIRTNDDAAIINPAKLNENQITSKLANVYRLYADNESIEIVSKQTISNNWSQSDRHIYEATITRTVNVVDYNWQTSRNRVAFTVPVTSRRRQVKCIERRCFNKPITKYKLSNCRGVSLNLIDLNVCSEWNSSIHFSHSLETHSR